MSRTTDVLRNARDASVTYGKPSTPFGDAHQLHLESGAGRAFIYFNRPFTLGASIFNATLRVYTKGSWGTSPTLTVKRVTERRWGETGITWNNQPGVAGTPAATLTQSSAVDGDLWEFDITGALQNVSNGAVWYGLRIETTGTTPKFLYSSEAAEFKPELEVTWSEAPQAPTTLSPSGGQVVSIAKPTLTCDFTDRSGSTTMAAIQAQIDSSGNFTTPAFDSGGKDATEPELDLTDTAYAGLAAGAETRYRMRVKDEAGQWSPWSDVVRFRRDLKGTLTVDNPPASGIVSEWTPPMIATLTGETLTAWRVIITPDDEPATHLYDSRRTRHTEPGNTFTRTLPKAILVDDGDYRAVFRTWDSKDRVNTPGDPPYTEVVRTFHFAEDPTPNPVTGLAAANLYPRAWVDLTFSRATAPDSFTLVEIVDGKKRPLESDIDPADALQSGTSYRIRYKEARPFRSHQLMVQAVVNGKTSTGNPTVTITPETFGVWLTDPDRDIDVLIAAGRNPAANIAMGEEGTTHYPIGASRAVRIRHGKRGWEGSVTDGRLIDGYGYTADQWQDRFIKLLERSTDLIVTIGKESFRAQVFNMSTPPLGDLPTTHRVSFEFFQTGRRPFDLRW